jgi:hypothetical protein
MRPIWSWGMIKQCSVAPPDMHESNSVEHGLAAQYMNARGRSAIEVVELIYHLVEEASMDWILARPRARARATALSNDSIEDSRSVAEPQQGPDAITLPAQPRNHLDYATWYAAFSGSNDCRLGDRETGGSSDAAPGIDLRDLLIPEADAA